MANIKISELSNAGALNGSEYLPIVQGNATVKTTTQDVVGLLGINYTPENVANKSDSYTVSSSTTYGSTKAIVDGLDQSDAYRLAFEVKSTTKASSIWVEASKTIKKRQVAQRIADLRLKLENRT